MSSPAFELRRRLMLASRLDHAAPPELWDGLPIEWAREPADLSQVAAIWRAWRTEVEAGRLPSRLQAYAHVPYCRTRCGFCQFATLRTADEESVEVWLRRLERESEALAEVLERPRADAITIGGGTPSSLSAAQLARVLAALDRLVARDPADYFSVELNPDSTDEEKLALLAEAGVTRLSFGAQSLHADTLAAVARGYQTPDMVERAVRAARALRGPEVGLDLMASLPRETADSFERGLKMALALGPDQLVVYEYQPVVRGRRTMPQGDLSFREASDLVRRLAPGFGYQVAAHTAASIVAQRPGSRRYRVQYMQHPREPRSTVALGSFAQSHAFGVGHYVGLEGVAGGYALQLTSPAVELSRHLGRRLGAGLPVEKAMVDETFGAGTFDSLAARFEWLERRGGLRAIEAGWTPEPHLRELTEAPWVLLDRLTVDAIARRARPTLLPDWLLERAPEIASLDARLRTSDARIVDARLQLGPSGDAHPVLVYALSVELGLDGLEANAAAFAEALGLTPAGDTWGALLSRVAKGELSEPEFRVHAHAPRLEIAVDVQAEAEPVVSALLRAARIEPARADLLIAARHARSLCLRQEPGLIELSCRVRAARKGPLMKRIRATAAAWGAPDLFDEVALDCDLELSTGRVQLRVEPSSVSGGDRLRRRLREICPSAPLWQRDVPGALASAAFTLRGARPARDSLCLAFRARAPSRLHRADDSVSPA